MCERWVYDPYFQYFTGEEFFQHRFPHERSGLTHWRQRIGDKLEVLLQESLRVAHDTGALTNASWAHHRGHHGAAQECDPSHRRQADAEGDRAAGPSGAQARGGVAAVLCPRGE